MAAERLLKTIHPLANIDNLAGKPIGVGPKRILNFDGFTLNTLNNSVY